METATFLLVRMILFCNISWDIKVFSINSTLSHNPHPWLLPNPTKLLLGIQQAILYGLAQMPKFLNLKKAVLQLSTWKLMIVPILLSLHDRDNIPLKSWPSKMYFHFTNTELVLFTNLFYHRIIIQIEFSLFLFIKYWYKHISLNS